MERTFVMIKPDAFHRGFVGRIIAKFEQKGLKLVAAKMLMLNDEILEKMYAHLKDKPFFGEIKKFMKSGPVLATVWEGIDAVETVRKLLGKTKAREAEPGTLRGDWAMSVMCNLAHASDSQENAKKEISLFFSEEEILSYERAFDKYLYAKHEA